MGEAQENYGLHYLDGQENEGVDVPTIGDEHRKLGSGEVAVETSRPGLWDVYSLEDFEALIADRSSQNADIEDSGEYDWNFNPSLYSANEVADFLARGDVPDNVKERVREEERLGKNRSSALR